MARTYIATLLSILCLVTNAAFTREEVNERINKDEEGVFLLNEETFDDFINYNDLVLICFHESGDLTPILREYMVHIDRKVQETKTKF